MSRYKREPVKPVEKEVIDATMLDEDDFGCGDEGEYEDVIEIDSD